MQHSIRSLSLSLSLSLSIYLSLSLSLSISLSFLSVSLSLSPIINISDEAPHISCGRFPWKTERDGTGVNKRENCRGNFFLPDFCIRSLSLTLSLSLPLSLSLALSLSRSLSLINNYIHAYMCLTVGRQSRDHRPLSRDPSVSFTKSFLIAWNVRKRCLTVSRRSRDLRPLSRDRSATFFKKFSNCLKRPKNVVWQSADGRVTLTTVAWPFSDFFQIFL